MNLTVWMIRLGISWLVIYLNSSFEEMYEDELIFLGIHVTHIILCDNDDEFVKSGGEKRRRKSKVMNNLERMRAKMTKRLISLISPLKGYIGMMKSELE